MFIAYNVSLDLVRALRSVVATIKARSRELSDQIERAATSVVLNLAEGNRRAGGDRRRFFAIAHGSASEVRGALDAADAWGWSIDATESRVVLDRLMGLLYGLTRQHPKQAE